MGATPCNLSVFFVLLCVCVCFCSLCFVCYIFVFKNGWKFVHAVHFYGHTSLLNTSVQFRSLLQKCVLLQTLGFLGNSCQGILPVKITIADIVIVKPVYFGCLWAKIS